MFSKYIYIVVLFLLIHLHGIACDCPLTRLSLNECNKYELIFKAKIKTVVESNSKLSEIIFDVEELYKGNASQFFKVLYDNKDECAQTLVVGQEWIIYSRYKQIDNAKLDWCSRSRRHFNVEKEDFYTITYGNDYDDELKFLRKNLGVHRLLVSAQNKSGNRNELPNVQQSIIIVITSILALLLFYFLFNKFFK